MKIVKATEHARQRLRADLSRISVSASHRFLSEGTVRDFVTGKVRLDITAARVIIHADKAITYIEKFVKNNVPIKKADHIIALLCTFSEDSLGERILSEEFYDYVDELQDRLDECKEHNYNGVLAAISIMDFLGFSDFLDGKPHDVWFLLYNMFLMQEGLCLILDDTDSPDAQLLYGMKYRVDRYASANNL